MGAKKQGLLFVVAGPAGSGKTTVCNGLLARFENMRRVVTATTRPPRPKERDGRDYVFLSPEAFEKKARAGAFVEHAVIHGNRYGTLRERLERPLRAGRDLLLNIDVQGAAVWRALNRKEGALKGRVVSLFILPKSIAELRRRLVGRGAVSPEELRRRLATARAEIPRAAEFDYAFVSGSREHDLEAAAAVVLAEKYRVRPARGVSQERVSV